MSNALATDFTTERESLVAKIKSIQEITKDRGGDLSDDDLESISKMQARVAKIDKQLDVIGVDVDMPEETAERLRNIGKSNAQSAPQYRTAGELLWDCLHATFGSQHDRDDREAKERWGRTMKRAEHSRTAEHMGTTASATKATAGGFGSLWVSPTVGPVLDLSREGQPFLNAIGKQQAPNSLTFARPRLIDANLLSGGAGLQTLQKDELVSKAFNVDTSAITLKTYGGYLNVSQQLLSLHPEALNIIVTQLQRRVAIQGETAAITELYNSTNAVTLATGADSELVIKALYDGAVAVWNATNMLPTWIAYGPLGWARLGKVVDSSKRPLFPFVGPQNALGTGGIDGMMNVGMGLQSILTPGITNTDIWIGNSASIEAYSYQFPVLEAVEPSVFGRQVAVAEALAFFRPITTEPSTGNGAVKIGP